MPKSSKQWSLWGQQKKQKNAKLLKTAIDRFGNCNRATKVLRLYSVFKQLHRATVYRWVNNPPAKLNHRQLEAIRILMQHKIDSVCIITEAMHQVEESIKRIQDLIEEMRIVLKDLESKKGVK